LRLHGKWREKYNNVRIGLNSRLDAIQAAIPLEKLAAFPEDLQAMQRVAAGYTDGLLQGQYASATGI